MAEKQKRQEERAQEREKDREEKRKREEFLKEWSKHRDDLECDDLKVEIKIISLCLLQHTVPSLILYSFMMSIDFRN